jgi:hypothetical protein
MRKGQESGTGNPRRRYRKPKLEQVNLVLEEAVLVTCKRGGIAGPSANNCSPGQGCPKQNPS